MKRLFILLAAVLLLCSCAKVSNESTESASEASSEESSSEAVPAAEESEASSASEPDASNEPAPAETSEVSEESSVIRTVTVDLTFYPGSPARLLVEAIGSDEDPASVYDLLPEEALACYDPLEGYILPAVYEVEEDAPLLRSILEQSLTRIRAILDDSGSDMSMHELVTRASIVQIESSTGVSGDPSVVHPEVMSRVSAVIENRLTVGMPLQMEVTRWYAEDLIELYGADPSYKAAYNTYEAAALPLGPVGCPTEEAVEAALHPEETSDYFFVWSEEGDYYFAEEYADHLVNCEKAGLY